MTKEIELLKRRLQREIQSRKNAEAILEAKALELYESNQSLQALNIELEDRIQEALEKIKKESDAAQKSEKQFLANMSHEIRTPLNAIIGMTQLLTYTNLNTGQQKYTRTLSRSADILKSLIDDILDISKIESGKLEVRSDHFNLFDLCKEIIEVFQTKNEGSTVQFQMEYASDLRTSFVSDTKLIRQILNNLIGNAEKFTTNGYVHLSIKNKENINNQSTIEFSVEDTGIGIPKEKTGEVFGRFKQIQNHNSNVRGTGLGLAITKQLVELLGGKIEVKSIIKKGSTFTFTLPLIHSDRSLDTPTHEVNSNIDISKINILVVEDTQMNQLYIDALLEMWSCRYDIVDNGYQAIKKCADEDYDIILMDIQMPGINGIETTKKIRAQYPRYRSTPIIALSAATFQSNIDDALKAGLDGFLAKPYTPTELKNKIDQYVGESSNINISNTHSSNIAFIDDLYEGNYHHALKMMDIFLDNIDHHLDDLSVSISDVDFGSIQSISHKIKPMFGMIGQPKYAQKMGVIQASSEHSDIITIRSTFDYIMSSIPDIKEQIAQIQNKFKNSYAHDNR